MDLSVIIVGYNCCGEIEQNLASMEEHFAGFEYEVIIVNNYPGDGEIHDLAGRHPGLVVLDDGINHGFGRANNRGLSVAKGRYICFLNPDIIILNNILPLIRLMDQDKTIGLAAPLLRNRDMSIQQSCYELPRPVNWFSYTFYLNALFPRVTLWGNYLRSDYDRKGDADVGWVGGAYMLTRKSLMDELGGFDPEFFMYCEDTDLCWRLRNAGYRTVYSDRSEAVHLGGVTTSSKSARKAGMMVQSFELLWGKYYGAGTVRRMLKVTYYGAALKIFCWKAMSLLRLGERKDEIEYNRAVTEAIQKSLDARKSAS